MLNVRICNKFDTLENWQKSELILMPGEFGIASFTNEENIENYIVRVGDGKNKFIDLKEPNEYLGGNGINITEENNQKLINADLPVKALTQAEYDALTPEEQMSNTLFIITDGKTEPLALVPSGTVIAWYGSLNELPYGYVLCNGENNTPDLRGKFIIGAGSEQDMASTVKNEFVGFVDNGENESENLQDNAQIISEDETVSIYSKALYYIMKI